MLELLRNASVPGLYFQAGPIAVVNFNRSSTKSIDDPRIKALGKVDTAIELGGYVGIGKTGVITSPYDKLSVSLSYRHDVRSEEHTSELQSLMRISYAVFCLKKTKYNSTQTHQ